MKKMTKKILSMILAGAMVLAMGGMSAFAADGAAETHPLAGSKLVKELTVADGIDISAVNTFTFSFTAKGSDTAAVTDHKEVTAQEITVGAQNGGKATGEKALSKIFAVADFPHAGEYVYEVAETTEAINTTDGTAKKTLTVDDTVYTLRIYVTNGTSGLEITGVTVAKGDEKVDPTKDEFKFANTYKEELESEEGVLTVTKKITGAYADKTKKFPITVELKLPSTAEASDVALAEGSAATLSGTTATAKLADGGEIKFAKLPAGTTFVVKETQDSAYKSKVTGDVKTADSAYVAGNVEKEGKAPITSSAKVEIENNREDVIPTGVVINNLPYILLVAIAVAGVVYMQMKKRI